MCIRLGDRVSEHKVLKASYFFLRRGSNSGESHDILKFVTADSGGSVGCPEGIKE